MMNATSPAATNSPTDDAAMAAVLETKLTDAFSTPGTAEMDFSTALAQLAHDMPSTCNLTIFMVFRCNQHSPWGGKSRGGGVWQFAVAALYERRGNVFTKDR